MPCASFTCLLVLLWSLKILSWEIREQDWAQDLYRNAYLFLLGSGLLD